MRETIPTPLGMVSSLSPTVERGRSTSDESAAGSSNGTRPGSSLITQVNRDDVLCGRGGKIMSHEGNVQFRSAIEQRRGEYSSASKERKREIAQTILGEIQGRGGRFIQTSAEVAGAYERVSNSKALDKCFHALREKKGEAHLKQKKAAESTKRGRTTNEDDKPGTLVSLCRPLPSITTSGVSTSTEEERAEESERNTTACALLNSVQAHLDRPRITDADFEAELRLMTLDEKVEAINDIFGKYCTMEDTRRRQRRETIDHSYVKNALMMMRHEIDWIPDGSKCALMEAQTKCRQEEFSDSRLEAFLRSVDWHPKGAAGRFVNYWEKRRDLFGPDRWHMPMTLSGALRDDLAALKTGMGCVLPHLDASGRQILWYPIARNTFEGYTGHSLLRAAWYSMEVACRHGTDVVCLGCFKDTTLKNIDVDTFCELNILARCWPIKPMAIHYILLPQDIHDVLQPVVRAAKGRDLRVRSVIHSVPESQLIDQLAGYGILADVLPTAVGGEVEFSIDKWIESRRKAENEEIGNGLNEEMSAACHAGEMEEDHIDWLLEDKAYRLLDDLLVPSALENAFNGQSVCEPGLDNIRRSGSSADLSALPVTGTLVDGLAFEEDAELDTSAAATLFAADPSRQ